ncbi:unnamed protein product [Leptosia nina]|uniref:Uncharacterized protein n=1 Tax=Leptosia nina TaxID=320188 RepID=A0AAV1JLT9_9NEOP
MLNEIPNLSRITKHKTIKFKAISNPCKWSDEQRNELVTAAALSPAGARRKQRDMVKLRISNRIGRAGERLFGTKNYCAVKVS